MDFFVYLKYFIMVFSISFFAYGNFQNVVRQNNKQLPFLNQGHEISLTYLNTRLLSNKHFKVLPDDESPQETPFSVDNNEFGFRVTEIIPQLKNTKHLMFSGCSFTYGQGVENFQTLPSLVSTKLKQYNTYNLAMMGYSVKESLLLLNYFSLKPMIKEETGIFIYNLAGFQFERHVNAIRYLNWATEDLPYWTYNNSKLILSGQIKQLFKWKLLKFFEFLKLDYFFLRFASHFYNYEMSNSLQMTIDLILNLKEAYLKQYPKGRFVITRPLFVKFAPEIVDSNIELNFLKILKEKNIEVLDPSEFEKTIINSDKFFLPDGHPSAKNYQAQTDFLVQRISKW